MVNTRKLVSIIAKVLLTIAIVLAVYAVAGFYIVPAVLEAKLPDMIEQQTGRKASVERIQFNPFLLVASLQNVKVQEKNGQPFAAFDHFHFDVNAIESIKQAALVIDDVRLEKPFVHIARQKSGDFNFSDLIKEETAEPKPEEEMFPATIGKLSVVEGKLAYEDASGKRPIKEQIFPIHLEIDNFSTLADKLFNLSLSLASSTGGQVDWQGKAGINPVVSEGRIKLDKIELQKLLALGAKEKAPLEFKGNELLTANYQVDSLKDKGGFEIVLSLVMNTGEQLNWKGTINTEPMSSEGHIKLEKVTLDRIQQLALQDAPFNLKGEELLEADYKASYRDDNLKLAVSRGRFDIRGFQLSERDQDKVLVKLPSFSVRGIDLDLNRQQVGIDSVSVDGADVQAWLNADGVINYQALLAANKGEETQPQNSTPQPAVAENTPWQIKVDNIALNNSALAFEDRTVKSPVAVKLSGINFKLNNFSTEAGASMPFQFDANVNNGTIALKGDMVNEPFSTRISVDAKNIGLEPFQSYLEKFARLDIMDGKFNMNGKLSVALQEQKPPDIKFDGGSGIADLITRDQLTHKDFIKWKNLALQDIKADVLAERYTAGALTIDKPYARVIIKKDKSVNFNEVMVADEKAETKTKPAKKAKSAKKAKPAKTEASADDSKKTYFKIDRIQVTDGSSDFADLSLILPFAARITDLNGGAGGFSSEKKSQVKVALKGMAYDLAPVDIKGEVSPYQGDFDLEMNFRGMPMPLISPYMVEFAGYKVEKGKMTLGLKYTVDDNKLTASNSILIDQLVLGEKVENPDAVSLPLELAVALLKDSEGKIKIDVPITGSLEDPKFSIGGLITDALVNVITKIIKSPFNALASVVNGKGDLSEIGFAAGKAELDEQQQDKLKAVAKALRERPALDVEIKGAAFLKQDWPALTDDALLDQLKKRRAAEIDKEGSKKILAEYIELSDEQYKRLLADMFMEKFPLLADRSFFGTPRLKDSKAGDFYEVAKQKLTAGMQPEQRRLKALASRRAQAIAKYLVQQGGIENDRVFVLDSAIDPKRENDDIVSSLSLKPR
jgi:flagellar motor protein MotB